MTTRSLAFVLLVSLAGCGEETSPPAPLDPLQGVTTPSETPSETPSGTEATEVAEPETVPPPTEAQQAMHDRYDTVRAMRSAFVRGDLAVAQALARPIGPVEAELPEPARDLHDVVPERARAVVGATDVESGARAFGQMMEACGHCHRLASATWTFETPPIPDGDDLPQHMQRHQWAIDRMWEALLVADAERFDMGARALSDAPLTGDDAPDDEEPPGLSELARRVHERAGEATTATSMRERAQIFGDLLGTCAQCHQHFEELNLLGVE